MTNYENDIMNLLEGNTPKQKYEYLLSILQKHKVGDIVSCDFYCERTDTNGKCVTGYVKKSKGVIVKDDSGELYIESLDNLSTVKKITNGKPTWASSYKESYINTEKKLKIKYDKNCF
jgi:hypothetical protein